MQLHWELRQCWEVFCQCWGSTWRFCIAAPGAKACLESLVLTCGIGLCGYAGKKREESKSSEFKATSSAWKGVAFAGVGGSLTAALNVALAYGEPLSRLVRELNPDSKVIPTAILAPVLFAGGIPGLAYCLVISARARALTDYVRRDTAWYWVVITGMSALWYGSVWLYGNETALIGSLGAAVGWPVFMSGIIISSFIFSVLAGEWRGSGVIPRAMMIAGIGFQAAAMFLFAEAVNG